MFCCVEDDADKPHESIDSSSIDDKKASDTTFLIAENQEHATTTHAEHAPTRRRDSTKFTPGDLEQVVARLAPTSPNKVDPNDILAEPRKLGALCNTRMPKVGEVVTTIEGTKTAHDVHGNPKAWSLNHGEFAEVLQVDSDGDFRLRDINCIESGWVFGKDFVFAPRLGEEERQIAGMESTVPCFDLIIDRAEGTLLGMSMDTMCPHHLEVHGIQAGGLVAQYNATAHHNKQVKVGYFVVGVAGVTCKREEIYTAMRQIGSLDLRIAPNILFTVSIEKAWDAKLGLALIKQPMGRSLLVSKISAGCLSDYNDKVPPQKQVKEEDRIIEVNGISEDCNRMLEMTRAEVTELKLVISRPAA